LPSGLPSEKTSSRWNDLVYPEQVAGALDRLLATNDFPEFKGRLCPAPCEGSCVLGINAKPVTIKQIELEIIERGFSRGMGEARTPAGSDGEERGGGGLRPGGPGGGAASSIARATG